MILVPVKNLGQAKQRLSPVLTPEQRIELARAMVEDVFDALAPFAAKPQVAVVSGDAWASRQAKSRKFAIIVDDANPGESGAIKVATSVAQSLGAEFTVVFPADIPLIASEDVQTILDLAPRQGFVIVPAADGRGTNAILRRPADAIPLRFGNDSFKPHVAAARATGYEVIIHELPRIALDVDRPDDLDSLFAQPGTTRAQCLLREWKSAQELPSAVNA